jgi:streptomycin 6-kinase
MQLDTPLDSREHDPEWLNQLPSLLDRCVDRWSIELGEQLEGGYLGHVRGCTGPEGEDLVLKVSPPFANPTHEASALAHWGGRGAARLVASDADIGALLLERIRPSTLLMDRDRSTPDDELAISAATRALAAMQDVHAPQEGSFPSFEEKLRWWLDYAAVYAEPEAAGTAMLPLFERAALTLDASANRKTLAHGDFIAKNVLLGPDSSYVAVDPLPFIGDPCSDVGQFSAYHSPVATVISRARAIAEATGNDSDRAAQWTAVWMVFQACETWRDDSDEVQSWVMGDECHRLLCARP